MRGGLYFLSSQAVSGDVESYIRAYVCTRPPLSAFAIRSRIEVCGTVLLLDSVVVGSTDYLVFLVTSTFCSKKSFRGVLVVVLCGDDDFEGGEGKIFPHHTVPFALRRIIHTCDGSVSTYVG